MWKKKQIARNKEEEEEELESAPFPWARVKLGGRVSSYQVPQPLTYIFEPLTVAQIKGLLDIFHVCPIPAPSTVGHTKRSPCTFLMFGKDKYTDSATLVI